MCRETEVGSICHAVSGRNSCRIIVPYFILLVFAVFKLFDLISVRWMKETSVTESHLMTMKSHDVKFRYPVCSRFNVSSMADLWLDIEDPVIFNSTYLPRKRDSEFDNETDITIQKNMMEWNQRIIQYYSPEKMRQSLACRPSNLSILRLLDIISNYPTTKIPLKILVTGGSVTAGHWCGENPVGWQDGGVGAASFKECAWPSRLERHLRKFFFNDVNEPGIIVHNMAVTGSSIEVAAMILEYQLLPDDLLSPDVILFAHSPNDSNLLNVNDLFYNHLNNAVQAAKMLRKCHDDLPMVGLIDDSVGLNNFSKAMETTARYYSIASWYQLLMINYGNVVRQTLIQRYKKERIEPLMGGTFKLHMGMGFHMGMAWTIMFDFLSIIMEACFEFSKDLTLQPISFKEWEDETKLESLEGIPWRPPPSKQFGGLYPESNPMSVVLDWKKNLQTKELSCNGWNSSEAPQPICSYAWMVNKIAGIEHPEDIDKAFLGVLKSSVGWKAMGDFYSSPRLGYYAQEENASFCIEIHVTSPTLYFTILSMESFGPNFVNTNLHIDVEIHVSNDSMKSKNTTLASYDISGYHKIQTSTHEIHKFQLPSMVNKGDIILFNATLSSGHYFKIAGLAFCMQ